MPYKVIGDEFPLSLYVPPGLLSIIQDQVYKQQRSQLHRKKESIYVFKKAKVRPIKSMISREAFCGNSGARSDGGGLSGAAHMAHWRDCCGDQRVFSFGLRWRSSVQKRTRGRVCSTRRNYLVSSLSNVHSSLLRLLFCQLLQFCQPCQHCRSRQFCQSPTDCSDCPCGGGGEAPCGGVTHTAARRGAHGVARVFQSLLSFRAIHSIEESASSSNSRRGCRLRVIFST